MIKMISPASSFSPNVSQLGLQMMSHVIDHQEVIPSTNLEAQYSSSLLYNLSVLRDKINQVHSLVSLLVSPDQPSSESVCFALATMGSVVQELILAASSIMSTCQHLTLASPSSATTSTDEMHHHHETYHDQLPHIQTNFGNNRINVTCPEEGQSNFFSAEALDWFGESHVNCNMKDDDPNVVISETNNNYCRVNNNKRGKNMASGGENIMGEGLNLKGYDIIEVDATDLLAKYTHYCQVCGKGFKRDANLRMHMRAHGDEYKTSAALSKPMKNIINGEGGLGNIKAELSIVPKKYSCPQEGCRWNQRHPKFQPLKSMICVKNHYKRSHCPKMYVCKRCNQKQFSVLSDLRTHEKHCGDLKWQCSCGTTFSRKDKLMGHVALFVGHAPAASALSNSGKVQEQQT